MPSIALCLIVRDEGEVLARCLESVAGVADELIVVDTGSTDDTVSIAESHGACVEHFPWCDDFAAARNRSFELATKDYILWLDADDVVLPQDRQRLLELKERLKSEVYYLRYDYAQDEYGNSQCLLYRERIVRNRPDIRWRHPVHEFLSVAGLPTEMVDITITHRRTARGYQSDIGRNLRILQRAVENPEYRDDARIQFYLGREYHDAGKLAEALEWYERSLKKGSREDHAVALHRMAVCHHALARKEETDRAARLERARTAARAALQLDPQRAEAAYLLGLLALEDHSVEEAIFWFQTARKPLPPTIGPVEPGPYTLGPNTQLCICYDRLGNHRLANYYNEVSLVTRPKDAGLLYNRRYLRPKLNAQPNHDHISFGAPRDGYIHVAETPDPEADDIFPMHRVPREDGSVAAIACACVPSGEEAEDIYRELRRVLAAGGELMMNTDARGTTTNVDIAVALQEAGFVVHYAWQGGQSLVVRALAPLHEKRIAFAGTPFSLDVPQFRIRIHHVNEWLRSKGYRSEVIGFGRVESADVVVFCGRYDQKNLSMMKRARAAGRTVMIDVCEDLLDFQEPFYRPMITAADMVIACSYKLAARLRMINPNVVVIEDAVEGDWEQNCEYDERRRLTFGWIGMTGNEKHAERLRPLLAAAGHQLVTIHRGPNADIPWRRNTWRDALARCDAAIVPLDVTLQPSKSNNKITTCMALGLPVVASPLDAYVRIIRHGENGLIATSDAEWTAAFERLKNPAERARIGRAGKETARQYSIDAIGEAWVDLLFQEAVVDIVIPTCGADEYLQLCLQSIAAVTDMPYRVIVVDSAKRDKPLRVDDRRVTVVRSDRHLNFAEAVNRGIAAGSAPYICLLNDDTIVTRGWLQPLLEEVEKRPGICNPLSNCDFGTSHRYPLQVGGIALLPGGNNFVDGRIRVRGKESEGGVEPSRLYDFNPGYTRRLERQWVAAFCSVLPRAVYEKVGRFDEDFQNGCEDVDYCMRAARLGFKSVIDERSFIFHFGAVSREEKRNSLNPINRQRLMIKYGKPLVVIHTGPAFERWNARSVEEGGIGGSETAAVHMADELTKLGHRVVVFGDCPKREEKIRDVSYLHSSRFDSFIASHHADVFIASRDATLLDRPIRAQRRWLWIHDVFAVGGDGGDRDPLKRHYDTLDGIFCLSPWHRDNVARHHGIRPQKIVVTRNGIDPDRFPAKVKRIRNRFIYSSSPDRGLDTLLDIFPRIRAELPDAELHVFYGFANWEKALAIEDHNGSREWLGRIKAALDQPGVVYHGRVGQRQLAEEMARSDVWLYPTRFTETYCITAVEAQMAGVLCICSDLAGLKTTVGPRGVLLKGDAYSEEYRRKAVHAAVSLLRDRRKRNAMTAAARKWAAAQTWASLAREWTELFGTHTRG